MLYRIALLLFVAAGLWADRVHRVVKAVDRESLLARGFRVVEPLGDGEWIVSVESNSAGVSFASPLPANKKISEEL
ncbi:MAG: hypothetical protein NTW74_25470, partial [Acidobacteria bacterium]|nr:hypothetical protein [Acidobacteriota bacterium]